MKFRVNKGFTLVEMMVAVSVFTIVAVIVSGAFVTLAGIFQKIQSNRAVTDNISFVMDTMTLQIREGKNYQFGHHSPCGDDCWRGITFDEYIINNGVYTINRTITYRLEDGQIFQNVSGGGGEVSLTSPEIRIDDLRFFAFRAADNPELPYLVIISLRGESLARAGRETTFNLQTALSQRNN